MFIDDNKIFNVGAVRYYSCYTGLVPTGKIKIKCIDNKGIPEWTKPIHSCKGESALLITKKVWIELSRPETTIIFTI